MTKDEKREQFKPKKWGLYNNGKLVRVCSSHTSAKTALFYKCESLKEHPHRRSNNYYTIKPYDE